MNNKSPTVEDLYEWGYHLVPWTKRATNSAASQPLVRDFLSRSTNPSAFKRLFPECDWACVPTFALVLDLERKNGLDGVRALDALGPIPDGPVSHTKSGGMHRWFRQPDDPVKGGFYLMSGVEVKAINATVHIPPSTGYSWEVPLCHRDALPSLPAAVLRLLQQSARRQTKNPVALAPRIPVGGRRLALCSLAGRLRNAVNATEEELEAFLAVIRHTRCDDPGSVSDEEIHTIARDFALKEAHAPRQDSIGAGMARLLSHTTGRSRAVYGSDDPPDTISADVG